MMVSQLVRKPSDHSMYSTEVYYQYTEYISKNNLHRFKDSKAKKKVVKAYARPGTERCLVQLLDMYLPLLPPGSDLLYMRPCNSFPTDPLKPAYCKQRVGVNQLKKFIPTLVSEAGISGYTNHS